VVRALRTAQQSEDLASHAGRQHTRRSGDDTALRLDLLELWLTYAASAALAIWIARRCAGGVSRGVGLALALLPLVFTGKALLRGELYGPSDLYYADVPWKELAAAHGVTGVQNPILSDLAFANLPWRAAVRDAIVNGHAPLWNRFALAGNPLLGTGSAAVLHPATWLGIHMPVALSWTFSCSYAIFLSLLCAFVFFRDFGLSERAALAGAVAWGFSTDLVFWNGWSVGLSTGTLPLLLLGLRRIAHGRRGVGLAVGGFLLSFFGGHPESTFHVVAAGAVYLAWELAPREARAPGRLAPAARAILLAASLALLLGAVQLLPLAEGIAHSAEYRSRQAARAREAAVQSVPLGEAARRLLPDALPFAYGIWGRSGVQVERRDGAGMPLGYAGAVVFPLALLALARRPRVRGRSFFAGCALIGWGFGASFPGLLDLAARLPGFALALNYRLVFLAALGLAGLAALGVQALEDGAGGRRVAVASAAVAALLVGLFLACGGVFRERQLSAGFVRSAFSAQIVPVLALGVVALLPALRGPRLAAAAGLLLIVQRGMEDGGTYPTLPAATLAPELPTLAAAPIGGEPGRVVAAGSVLRPNGAALYGLEDVRGYEAVVLDRLVDTFPLWSTAQHASFNRVDDLTRPFLSLLDVRWAIAAPDAPVPAGWGEQARGPEMAIFENPRALPRAFVPARLRRLADPGRRLAEMAGASDFAANAWLSSDGADDEANGPAALSLRASGSDLVVSADAPRRTLVATSIPDWPGWTARAASGEPLEVETVNHAFVGVWIPAGRTEVRLSYRPRSVTYGAVLFAAGIAACLLAAASRRGRGARTH